ncbi:hypothetical protein [Rubrivivax benzoatilyticus]|uniref:Uncharacterized protein n=1 Tax=Rubrivivax benzoatilyticus TaxID=316997 RepID=A0ABX0HT74_9BURK|nr:hypothetical protein [Rubrivivax benzoatilyticus]EGJ10986.1 hypothetical protein RBXJA2T_11693 [Rubrivivax benzoatilyticus JA2 = ATCC BAA-35]NHK97833.1 hypothetical protein [Rubrivivax benzoatilyticus]NHL23335.1 hypothetical protein [Rubrivivax benzoatilyticus]
MLRCVTLATLVAAVSLPASAQIVVQRKLAPNSLRGELVVTQAPAVLLNGQPALLAPGARIRGENNLIVLSASLTGQKLVVNYTRELRGQLLDVWILNASERAKRWPKTAEEAAKWRFEPQSQTWTQ